MVCCNPDRLVSFGVFKIRDEAFVRQQGRFDVRLKLGLLHLKKALKIS